MSPPGRRASVALCVAVTLAFAGVVSLIFQPQGASANVTPGVQPDFVVSPGTEQPKEFAKPLVGSAEVKGDPDDCRADPVTGLTCAAHRIKINRTPERNVELRISLEWDAYGDPTLAQAPDVDMYLFTTPTGALDPTVVGGAGTTSPEVIKIVPTQDEYDLVVQAYAGAITGYKLTVSYTSTATISGGITPDFVLSPDAPAVVREVETVIVGQPGLSIFPDGCRGPEYDYVCDVFRVKLQRNMAKDAFNFVVFRLDWTPQATLPDLPLAAVGLVSRPLPDLNLYVYDAPDHALEGVGGAKVEDVPERGGWEAKQDEYDIVVQSAVGIGLNYKLTLFMTDELFDKPFELLDPVTGEPLQQQPDGSFEPTGAPATGGAVSIPPLALAPVDVDNDIAGIGHGATEQFDIDEALRQGRAALRNASVSSKPPSGLILVLALVVLPLALFAAGVVAMRRRHSVVF